MLRGTTQLCARRRTLCNPVTWVIPSPPTILTVGSAALLPGELPASCPVRPLNLRSASLCQRMDGYFSGSRHLDASILPRKKGFCKGKICGIIKEKEGRAGHETAKRCGYRGGGAHGKSLQREGFLRRCFSPEEQEYICRKANPAETAAALWAAKEAFGKALGVGLSGWEMPQAAVTRDAAGAPHFVLTGAAAALAEGWELALSLSHDGGYAVAMVVAWRGE